MKVLLAILISLAIAIPSSGLTIVNSSSVIFMRDTDHRFHAICKLNCDEFDTLNKDGILDMRFATDIEAAENYLSVRAEYYGMTFIPLPKER